MFTLAAYSESNTPDGTLQNIAGVADQHIRVEDDSIYVPEFNRLLGAIACPGALPLVVQLVAPSLRRLNPETIAPVWPQIYPVGAFQGAVNLNSYRMLDINEQLQCEVMGTAGAARVASVVIMLSDSDITPVKGRIAHIRFQVTVTLVASTWAFAAIDFIDELPVTTYTVVGAALVCDEGVAFRFVPVGGRNRPGGPCNNLIDFVPNTIFRDGELGQWFQFSTVQPPSIEVLGSAAEASDTYEGIMDVLVA